MFAIPYRFGRSKKCCSNGDWIFAMRQCAFGGIDLAQNSPIAFAKSVFHTHISIDVAGFAPHVRFANKLALAFG